MRETMQAIYSAWVSNPEWFVLAAVTAIALIGIGWGIAGLKRARDYKYIDEYLPQIQGKALMKQRDNFVKAVIAGEVHYALEKKVWNQTLTRHEVNKFYQKMGKQTHNKHLFPARLSKLRDMILIKIDAHKNVDRIAKARKKHGLAPYPSKNKGGGENVIRPAAFGAKSLRRQGKG